MSKETVDANNNGDSIDQNMPLLLAREEGGAAPELFERHLLRALLHFKDGDFSSRMPTDMVGIEGKIADVFNEIMSVSERRAVDTARVCRVVGKEGKVKERIRV